VEDVVKPAREFWSGRRVVVTGHTGFKGGWLSLWLSSLGAEVHGIALPPPTDPSFFVAARVGEAVRSNLVDIRDYDKLAATMRRANPEVLFHLAAQPLVREAHAAPIETLDINIIGTAKVLEAARACPDLRSIVSITSDKVYRNREWHWPYRETDALGGKECYGISKACAELVTEAWRTYFAAERGNSLAMATARAGNVVGGGDWAKDRLIPDAMRAFAEGRPLMLRNPMAVRPWQHVLEPLRGYLMLAEQLYRDGVGRWDSEWNFGPADADCRPVSAVADQMVALWGQQASWKQDGTAGQPYEAHMLRIDTSKAARELNWRPRWDLSACLRHTIGWYRAHMEGKDMQALSLEQISAFTSHGGD